MTLQDLFDELLATRSVTLQVSGSEAHSLRVQLAVKWKRYKDMMSSCGFLSEELEACSLRRSTSKTKPVTTTFLLAPPDQVQKTYEILLPEEPA